jgi:hypothetical protein
MSAASRAVTLRTCTSGRTGGMTGGVTTLAMVIGTVNFVVPW